MINLLIFFLLFLINEQSFANIQLDDNNSSVEVIPDNGVFDFNNQKYIGLKITLEKNWKTYWKNPGDAGVSLEINFSEELGTTLEISHSFTCISISGECATLLLNRHLPIDLRSVSFSECSSTIGSPRSFSA